MGKQAKSTASNPGVVATRDRLENLGWSRLTEHVWGLRNQDQTVWIDTVGEMHYGGPAFISEALAALNWGEAEEKSVPAAEAEGGRRSKS